MKILLTGGAGYVGSHTATALLAHGYDVVILDNFVNSSPVVTRRLTEIIGKEVNLYEGDCRDKEALREIFSRESIDAVMHFAGLKAVGESTKNPLAYYESNIGSTLALCQVMDEFHAKKLIFSSSATVYGNPSELPLKESSRAGIGITNPYGQTKYMIEMILKDLATSDPAWQISILRYFNPIGAHKSGLIGEDPKGIPNNLFPYVAQVASGIREKVSVYGDDYDTPDGTGIRDYIHITDLAEGHVAALRHLPENRAEAYNLGTGKGTSVLEIIKVFEEASGKSIPYEITDRRPGDIATCYADPSKANEELRWKTQRSISDACRDTWNWQQKNPNGFE